MKRVVLAVMFIIYIAGTGTIYSFSAPSVTESVPIDTLVYHDYFEDPSQTVYILNDLYTYWVSVRFTPEAEFIPTSILFLVENLNGSSDSCYVYLALDSNGQPDPDSILAGPILVDGPLPNLQMIKVELDSGIVVDSLRDFHVLVGSAGLPSYSVALELPADFPERTGHTPNSHSGPFSGYEFPTMADAIIAVEGHYAGEDPVRYDLETICLSNELDLFFPDSRAALGLTFSSEVMNNGPDSTPEYTLSWMVLDETDSLVFQYDTLQPPLPPETTVSVSCPQQWTMITEGDYVVRDSVFVTGETDSTNNSSYLEQHIYFSRNLHLKYCDSEPEETFLIQGGISYAVRFVPWSRVASVDSVALFFQEESLCRISVLDGYFHDELPGNLLFTSEDITFQQGWNVYHFEDFISPTRSAFFIALTSVDDPIHFGIDSDVPITSQTCLPGQFFKSPDMMNTWMPTITDDPMMEVFVTKRAHPSPKYVEVLSCRVEPEEVLPGQTVKVITDWEFFNLLDDELLGFRMISGLAAYPSIEPFALDTLMLQYVQKGIYSDNMYITVPLNIPGGQRGISFALVASSSNQNLRHNLLGDFFYTLHLHHVVSDSF